MTTLLPIGLIGLTGQILWHINQSSKFNHCNRNYIAPVITRNSYSIFLGINSKVSGEFSAEISEEFKEVYATPVLVGVHRFLKKRIVVSPNDDPLSSYSIMLGVQKKFAQNFYITAFTNIFPNFTIRRELFDEYSWSNDFSTPTITLNKRYLFINIGLDAEYNLYNGLNNSWSLLAGFFQSNTISDDVTFDVMHPSLGYFKRNPVTTDLSYKYSVSGASIGISSTYNFSNDISFKMIYKFYYRQELELDGQKDKALFIDISANFLYNL